MKDLEKKIGYEFRDKGLLTLALTHSSYANERPGRVNNERLEFLGDSVLSIVVSSYIFSSLSTLPEGETRCSDL